ncbi:MAG: ABC transporter substrate-binding protein [Thermodesulfobacteriota bacterium]
MAQGRWRWHRGVTVFVLLVLAAGAASCRPGAQEPIRLGLAINLSGQGGEAGEHIRAGSLLAVEEINARGGINGRPLQLLVEDDGNTEAGVVAADNRLIDAGVVAIIGHSFSANTLVAYPVVMARKTLLFTSFTATTELSDRDDLFCRTSVDNKLYGQALASLLTARGIGSAAFLIDMSNASFGEDLLAQTRLHYHGAVTAVRIDSKQGVDWETARARLMADGPQAVVMLTEVAATGIGAQKIRAGGYQGELIATLWAQTPELWQYGGSAVDGMTILTFIEAKNSRLAYQAFASALRKRFNRPATARSVRAYEAVEILAAALRRCAANPTAEELKRQLVGARFDTVMGGVAFNASCDVVRPVYEVRVRGQEFVTVGEVKIAGGAN